jgi:hypothetical protein
MCIHCNPQTHTMVRTTGRISSPGFNLTTSILRSDHGVRHKQRSRRRRTSEKEKWSKCKKTKGRRPTPTIRSFDRCIPHANAGIPTTLGQCANRFFFHLPGIRKHQLFILRHTHRATEGHHTDTGKFESVCVYICECEGRRSGDGGGKHVEQKKYTKQQQQQQQSQSSTVEQFFLSLSLSISHTHTLTRAHQQQKYIP